MGDNKVRNTIKDEWDEFNSRVIPKTASKTQHREMKRAFYAGALAVLNIQRGLEEDMSDEAVARIIGGLYEELRFFAKQIQRGEA